jgi:hypothetical protein
MSNPPFAERLDKLCGVVDDCRAYIARNMAAPDTSAVCAFVGVAIPTSAPRSVSAPNCRQCGNAGN